MWKILFLVVTIICSFIYTTTSMPKNVSVIDFQSINGITILEELKDTINQCLAENVEMDKCFRKQILQNLDDAVKDNSTWHVNDYIEVERNGKWSSDNVTGRSNSLLDNIRNLAESRNIRIKFIPGLKYAVEGEEGRKKKDKHGDKGHGIAMVGCMLMIGLMAQMFMAKVATLAGLAFLMSKAALFFSLLKKATPAEPQVVYSDTSTAAWQRSDPRYASESSSQPNKVGFP